MDLGDLIRRGWNLTWNNKWIYVLGFLAALGGGGGFSGNFNVPSQFNSSQPFDPGMMEEFESAFGQISEFWASYGWLVVIIILAVIVLSVIFWLIGLVGRAGLIHAAAALDAKQPTSLRQSWAVGVRKLGRMAGLSILLALPFLLFFIVLAIGVFLWLVPVIRMTTTGELGPPPNMASFAALPFVFACLACIFVIYALVIAFLNPFAVRGLVLQDLGVIPSIRHGWQVLRRNLGNILILAVVFLVIGIIVGLIGIVVAGLLAAPFVAPIVLGLMRDTGLTTLNIVLAVVGGLVFLIVVAAINSILVAYQSTTFTLAYQGFLGEKQPETLPT